MRFELTVLATLIASPALAVPPPLCALPGPPLIAAAAAGDVPTPNDSPAALATTAAKTAIPAALTQIPFVQHVAAAGAAITDLGVVGQLHAFSARSDGEFMLFNVTPDGQAAISGGPITLTLAQLRTVADGNLTDLGTEHGLQGFFVRSGQQFQVFYAAPDEAYVIPGIMWDASGKDLTRQQIAKIPGAVPTVEVTASQAGPEASSGQSALSLVRELAFGTIGPASAPHLYMLIDPQCIYSIRAFQALRQFVDVGKLQISIVPLSVLDYEDRGQSTRSALAILSGAPDEIVGAWQSGNVAYTPTAAGASLLQKNMGIANAIGLKGTPTFVWRKPDGTEGRLDGMPADFSAFVASIGN